MLITSGSTLWTTDDAAVVRLPGLPEFNGVHPEFVVSQFDGWYSRKVGQPHVVANGGGPGAQLVRRPPGEALYTLGGQFDAGTPGAARALLRTLLGVFGNGSEEEPVEVPIEVIEPDDAPDLQMFASLYDDPDVDIEGDRVTFTLPLISKDPHKYGLATLTATAGGFAPSDWFRTYTDDGGDWFRTYTDDASWYRAYQEDGVEASALPREAALFSAGDAPSRRVQVTVIGPVSAGEWWVEDAAGNRITAAISLSEDQSIEFDTHLRTAFISGVNVDHLVDGEYPVLAPGGNSIRLVVGSSGAGSYMTVNALEGYL